MVRHRRLRQPWIAALSMSRYRHGLLQHTVGTAECRLPSAYLPPSMFQSLAGASRRTRVPFHLSADARHAATSDALPRAGRL